MIRIKQLAPRAAVLAAVLALVGASAFADSRPSKETKGHRGRGAAVERVDRGRSAQAARGYESKKAEAQQRRVTVERRQTVTVTRPTVTRSTAPRPVVTRPAVTRQAGSRVEVRPERSRVAPPPQPSVSGRRLETSDSFAYRGGPTQRPVVDYRSGRSSSQPLYREGRVSRVMPYRGGYRVWLGGVQYPFFVPSSYYRADRFRPGLLLRLGGFYNPLGYYDYYDGRSSGALRGTVESVDYRRDTFVIRNEATGSFVTVVARDRWTDVRPGDYVQIAGDWNRNGIFQAYDVDRLDSYRGGRYDDRGYYGGY